MTVSTLVLVIVVVVLGVVAVLVAWLVVVQLRTQQYKDQPVYRRLPDGRVQFDFTVDQEFQEAKRVVRRDI